MVVLTAKTVYKGRNRSIFNEASSNPICILVNFNAFVKHVWRRFTDGDHYLLSDLVVFESGCLPATEQLVII